MTRAEQKRRAMIGSSLFDYTVNLLNDFGYTVQISDNELLFFCMQTVNERIKNACNTCGIPESLEALATRMIAGEFFNVKKGMGQLNGLDLDFEVAVKQIKEGDLTTQFAVADGSSPPEVRFDALVSYLRYMEESQISAHREIKW